MGFQAVGCSTFKGPARCVVTRYDWMTQQHFIPSSETHFTLVIASKYQEQHCHWTSHVLSQASPMDGLVENGRIVIQQRQ